MSENINLGAALAKAIDASTATTTAQVRKRKGRRKSLKPEKGARFTSAIDVDPTKESLPPEKRFSDPLFYWQTRLRFNEKIVESIKAKVAELEATPVETRTASLNQRAAERSLKRVMANQSARALLLSDPSILTGTFTPEQVTQLIQQLTQQLTQENAAALVAQ